MATGDCKLSWKIWIKLEKIPIHRIDACAWMTLEKGPGPVSGYRRARLHGPVDDVTHARRRIEIVAMPDADRDFEVLALFVGLLGVAPDVVDQS